MPFELEPDSFQRRADVQTRARCAQRVPDVEYGVATFDPRELRERARVAVVDELDI